MPVRTAIVGVGNCAKSFVEGVCFYRDNPGESTGLVRSTIGPYAVGDIDVVCAFDVDLRKVGKPLDQALASEPNRTLAISPIAVPGVLVERGPTFDSIIPELRHYYIQESPQSPVDVTKTLERCGVEVVVNYLPAGSELAARAYAEAAYAAGSSFVNCMSAPIAKDSAFRQRFVSAGLALLGDDIKSQCGATVVHRALLNLLHSRGVRITSSTQMNTGGNADHFNLQFRPRSKEECKQAALLSVTGLGDSPSEVRMVFSKDNFDHKKALITLTGEIFGRVPVRIQVELDDEDSPNSGGIVIDAVRIAKLLCERGQAGRASDACAALMKSPPLQMDETDAARTLDAIVQNAVNSDQNLESDDPRRAAPGTGLRNESRNATKLEPDPAISAPRYNRI
jgi:myo-inositol-1-phosphate synthase